MGEPRRRLDRLETWTAAARREARSERRLPTAFVTIRSFPSVVFCMY